MNVFMTKLSAYLSANKFKIITILLILNAVLMVASHQAGTQYFGRVEAFGHQWTTHTEQNRDNLVTKNTFTKLNAPQDMNSKNIDFYYTFTRLSDNEYMSQGDHEHVPVRHNRVFYLDDTCSLVFSGPTNPHLKNTSLRCEY